MVEFGLKLQDNKVSDWGDYYIRYEKLKTILQKCGTDAQKIRELESQDPQRAAEVRQSFQLLCEKRSQSKGSKGDLSTADSLNYPSSRKSSSNSLTQLEKVHDDAPENDRAQLLPAEDNPSQTNADYGSIKSGDSASNLLSKAIDSVADYFVKPSFDQQMRDALARFEKHSNQFDRELNQDVKTVNNFYNDQLGELKNRLQLLTENVIEGRMAAERMQRQQKDRNKDAPEPPPSNDPSKSPTKLTGNLGPENNIMHNPKSDGVDSVSGESYSSDHEYLDTPLLQKDSRKSFVSNSLDVAKRHFARRMYGSTTGGDKSLPLTTYDNDKKGGDSGKKGTKSERQPTPDQQETSDEKSRRLREAESIQRALLDQYRSAKLLQNFAIMNYTGFVKIVKKFDKTISEHKGKYKDTIKTDNICNEGKTVEHLSERMEILYANWFCDRNRSEARAQMLPKRGDSLEMDWSQLRLGYRMGMCSILGLWVCWDCIWGLLHDGRSTIGGRTAFPVFRACGGLLLFQWFWGTSVWVWTRFRINYIYLFDFNPRIVNSALTIFNDAVDHTLVFLGLMLLYYKAGAHDIPGSFPAGIFPMILVLYTVYNLIFPLRTRKPMWQQIWLVLVTPMTSPTFFQGYIGDIFTSMVKVFQDMVWTSGFIISGDFWLSEDQPASDRHAWSKTVWYSNILIPLVTLLPLWLRFNQCLRRYADTRTRFPHLANAFKYALSQTVTLFGAFHPLYMNKGRESTTFQFFWRSAFIISSLYSFTWDVTMDWGLGRPKHQMLGPRLMYPNRSVYYIIICIDLVLRFAWVLTLVPPRTGAQFALPAYLTTVSMMLELFRRTLWGFLRLENEHRSNTAGFRRVGFVPLHFATGHTHDYGNEVQHRGGSVLVEVVVITLLVVGACVVSVVAAQHASEKAQSGEL